MRDVRPKKNLGQHFLNDKNIAAKIVKSLKCEKTNNILEIGPGMGVLSEFLLKKDVAKRFFIEIDSESVDYLKNNFPVISENIISADFLRYDLKTIFDSPFCIIGNFPYNISSQIFFKILDNKDIIPEVVGMLQKEVAERIASPPGSKVYGITSVLLQAYYDIELLFNVHERSFTPPPKVKSTVIRLVRNNTMYIECNDKLFKTVVKTSFNQRRKTLRNSLKSILLNLQTDEDVFSRRPEQLSVAEFIDLTNLIEKKQEKLH